MKLFPQAVIAVAMCAAAMQVASGHAFVQNPAMPIEYRFIRPADFDDTPPPIAFAELWPAQY